MKFQDEDLSAAQRSYDLRIRRLERATTRVAESTAALDHLFGLSFKYPDAARAKYSELVKERGLNYATKKMQSAPTDVVPKWKALRGEFGIINGPNREKELAITNLQKISGAYLKAEEAQAEKLLAEKMLSSAQQNLEHIQSEMPVIDLKPEAARQKRRLRQR